jgi:hypothetical protein
MKDNLTKDKKQEVKHIEKMCMVYINKLIDDIDFVDKIIYNILS